MQAEERAPAVTSSSVSHCWPISRALLRAVGRRAIYRTGVVEALSIMGRHQIWDAREMSSIRRLWSVRHAVYRVQQPACCVFSRRGLIAPRHLSLQHYTDLLHRLVGDDNSELAQHCSALHHLWLWVHYTHRVILQVNHRLIRFPFACLSCCVKKKKKKNLFIKNKHINQTSD